MTTLWIIIRYYYVLSRLYRRRYPLSNLLRSTSVLLYFYYYQIHYACLPCFISPEISDTARYGRRGKEYFYRRTWIMWDFVRYRVERISDSSYVYSSFPLSYFEKYSNIVYNAKSGDIINFFDCFYEIMELMKDICICRIYTHQW